MRDVITVMRPLHTPVATRKDLLTVLRRREANDLIRAAAKFQSASPCFAENVPDSESKRLAWLGAASAHTRCPASNLHPTLEELRRDQRPAISRRQIPQPCLPTDSPSAGASRTFSRMNNPIPTTHEEYTQNTLHTPFHATARRQTMSTQEQPANIHFLVKLQHQEQHHPRHPYPRW